MKIRARLPLPFHQLAKAGQNEFAVVLDLFVREAAERLVGSGESGLRN